MLKYIYKTLIMTLLSCSLILIDFSVKSDGLRVYVNSARAESVSTGGVNDSNMMATLTMVGISVIASRLILYGTLTTDIGLAAAGGLAFIAGDVAATNGLKAAKKKIETDIERGKNGDVTDQQRQALIRLIQMYQASKSAAETKKNLQLAAAAAFAAAAIAAYMATTAEMATFTACQTATTATTTAAKIAAASVYGSALGTACVGVEAPKGLTEGTYRTTREVPAPSCQSITSVLSTQTAATTAGTTAGGTCATFGGAAQLAACNAMFVGDQLNSPKMCVPPMVLLATTAAVVATMGITASTIVTAIVGFSSSLAEMVDIAIYTPKRRAIVWGVLAGLSYASSSATSNVITEIDGDIKKLNALLDTINSQANGTSGSNAIIQSTSSIASNSATNSQIKVGSTTSETEDGVTLSAKLPCITSEDANKCSSYSDAIKNTAGFTTLPEAFKNDIIEIAKTTDGLNGASKISGSTLSSASSAAANSIKLLNGLKNAKSDFTKLTNGSTNSGKSSVIADQEKELQDKINSAVNDALKKSSVKSSDLVAALNLGTNSSKDLSDAKLGNSLAAKSKVNLPAVSTGATSASLNYKNQAIKDEGLDKTADAVADSKDKDQTSIDDYELKNDITTDKSTNIFDVISTRYQKSGYPRLFKRISE